MTIFKSVAFVNYKKLKRGVKEADNFDQNIGGQKLGNEVKQRLKYKTPESIKWITRKSSLVTNNH